MSQRGKFEFNVLLRGEPVKMLKNTGWVGATRKSVTGNVSGECVLDSLKPIFTPPPVGGRGIVIERFLCLFVCLFVCLFISLSATLRENGWTDLHEIFREGVEWLWDDLIQFWVNSDKRVGGLKVKLFVIWFDCGLLAVLCCHLATENVMKLLFLAFRYVAARGGVCCAPHHSLFSEW